MLPTQDNIKFYALYRKIANDSKEEIFMKTQKKQMSTKTLVMGALMTALVIMFQILGTYTTIFGPFSSALAKMLVLRGENASGNNVKISIFISLDSLLLR